MTISKVVLVATVLGAVAIEAAKWTPAVEETTLTRAVEACFKLCEEQDPEDRGQGCIDLYCNPLFDLMEDEP